MTREPTDQFEHDLRSALRDAASEGAPERLIARVAAVPRTSPRRARWFGRFLGVSMSHRRTGMAVLVGVAAVVLVGVALLLPGTNGPNAGGPSAPVGSGGVGSPGLTPGGSAAGAPSASPSVNPPSRVPSSAGGPVGGPVPAGFQPVSVTFVSASEGFVLGSVPCNGSSCAAIVRTIDGGRTWEAIPAPTTVIVPGGQGEGAVIGMLRFADPLDGWAFGPDVWATHDGGASWHRAALPATTLPMQVMALEASGGKVHVAYFDATGGGIRLATSPIDAESWSVSPTTVQVGAGPVPHAQIVLHGSAGWLLENDRTVVGGAALRNGSWVTWQPPCLNAAGPAILAAVDEQRLVAACDVGVWSTPTGVHVFTSTDAGASFAEMPAKPAITNLAGIAGPDASTIVVAGYHAGLPALVRSTDGGGSWAVTYRGVESAVISELGFTTPTRGSRSSRRVAARAQPPRACS